MFVLQVSSDCSFKLHSPNFSLLLPLLYPMLTFHTFIHLKHFFPRDFSCDVLGAMVQVLWKGCSNGSSARTVLGGDGEGKWSPWVTLILCKIFTEISLRSRHDVCEILNPGEISSISPRLPRSRRDLTMMFVSFWISARFPPSRQDCWDLAIILSSSRRDFLHHAEIGETSLWSSTLSVSRSR